MSDDGREAGRAGKEGPLSRVCLLVSAGMTLWFAGGSSQLTALPPPPSAYELDRQFVHPEDFQPGRAHTPGVRAGKMLSEQTDRDPRTGARAGGIAAQARTAMDNLGRVLRSAGMDYGNVVSCHLHLVDMEHFADVNEVFRSHFGRDQYPARTTIELPALPGGADVTVTCIAHADRSAIARIMPPEDASSARDADPPAVWAGDTLYFSGRSGDPGGDGRDSTIEDQTMRAMRGIGRILSAAGLESTDAVFTNVYFVDPDGYKGPTYGRLNFVYREFFPLGTAPSRASVPVRRLPGKSDVTITAIATRDRARKGRVVPGTGAPSPTSSMGGVFGGAALYTSGKSGAGATLPEQARDSIESIRAILKLAGMNLEHVVDAHVYLKDIADLPAMDAIFQEYFPRNPPARTTMQVIQHQLVQVQVVAVR